MFKGTLNRPTESLQAMYVVVSFFVEFRVKFEYDHLFVFVVGSSARNHPALSSSMKTYTHTYLLI